MNRIYMSEKRLKSQPRIKGMKREPKYSGLLPVVRRGLEQIAAAENKSLSWVIAEIISDYFNLDSRTGKSLRDVRKNKRHRPRVEERV